MIRYTTMAMILLTAVSGDLLGISAAAVLKKIDYNEVYRTIAFKATMKIRRYGRVREKVMKIYGKGREKSYVHLLNKEDRGTKFLKIRDSLWVYLPTAEGVQKISGHRLKQGMLGSDVSYEDAMNNDELADLYQAKVAAADTFRDWDCWVLELTAKKRRAPYARQKIWVSQQHAVVVRAHKFSSSGRLLKEVEIHRVEKVGPRYLGTIEVVRDKRRRDSQTTFIMENIRYNMPIPDRYFSLKMLER